MVNIRRLSGLLKELKKIFRKRRKLGLSFVFLLIAAAISFMMIRSQERSEITSEHAELLRDKAVAAWSTDTDTDVRNELAVFLQENDVRRTVDVYTIYVCGEERQSFGQLNSKQILELMDQHPAWQVDESDAEQITFYEYVEDLSESCKQSAYIGIDEMDHLTLFEGLPNHDNAIRTFFQIDIEYLKTSLPKEAIDSLYGGIRIRDLAQYNSIISTFSQFAIEDAERAAGAEAPH